MTRFEPTIGVSQFAHLIRDSGYPMCNEKLLAMSEAGVFDGYDIYIFQMADIEGFIPKSAAQRWITTHSVEAKPTADMLEYALKLERSEASA